MASEILDAIGLPWLDYDLSVYHCPRCHGVVRIYDSASTTDDVEAILAWHNEVHHAPERLTRH
jgi:hypothetical protein